jgi:hypothetical protein
MNRETVMPEAHEDELIEVFFTGDEMVAQTAIEEVLAPAGIEAFVHDRVSHALPAPASMPGGYFVAVPAEQAEEAAQALRDALADGALMNGEVAEIGDEPPATA